MDQNILTFLINGIGKGKNITVSQTSIKAISKYYRRSFRMVLE